MIRRAAVIAAFIAGPAATEVSLTDVDTCLAADDGPGACVDAAHADCAAMGSDMHDAATLCYTTAKEAWAGGIRTRMESLRADAPAQIAAIAGIEVKYDVLATLVQCDRMEDLAKLTDAEAPEIRRARARCEAAASGLAYARLVVRARGIE